MELIIWDQLQIMRVFIANTDPVAHIVYCLCL